MADTPAPEYRIATLADFAQVPVERLAACLDEFADWCLMMRATDEWLRTLAPEHPKDKPIMAEQVFVWVDDGEHNMTMTMRCKDGEVEMCFAEDKPDPDPTPDPQPARFGSVL